MFNRANKLTALLVAAAATLSVVPANAATRLTTKDGNITSAVAFDGGYLFDGYKTDDDDTALYFNNGKDVEVEDYDDYDYDTMAKYGEKYVIVEDGGDQYLLDLSTGKILDDETLEDKEVNIASKLKINLKKSDRYDKVTVDSDNIQVVPNNSFGEVWYSYSVEPASNADGVDDVVDGNLLGFTTESGKYIDICNVANMTVVKPSTGKSVKVKEYNEEENGMTVSLQSVELLTQDADNFYVLAEVKVTEEEEEGTTQHFLQKISKAQGDKKDGAYVPKSVSSYLLDDGTIFDDEDMADAYEVIVGGNTNYDTTKFVAKNGNLTAVGIKDDEVQVVTFKLKKDKPTLAKEINGATKADAYVVMKDSDDDQDIVNGEESVSIDVDGNIWALDKGKIYKVEGTDFKETFTCDRSINVLDVYNENNLVAWDSNGDVYTTILEDSNTSTDEDTTTDEDNKEEEVTAKVGWDKNADGTWSFYDATGNQVKASWTNVGGTWYYLDAEGIMQTGWLNDRGTWYYLNASGAMQTGWLNDNGTWYYLNASGAMQTGWLNDNGTWYYLNASGAMLSNTTVDGYVLGANGAWIR